MDRQYAAQITYPFIEYDPVLEDSKAFLDMLLYVSPEDTDEGAPGFTDVGPIGAWLVSRYQPTLPSTDQKIDILVKVPSDPDRLNTALDVEPTQFIYTTRSFTVDSTAKGIVTVKGDDGRSVIVLDVEALGEVLPGQTMAYLDAAIEPSCVVPCRRRVENISLYNEYRAKDPADREALPPDTQEEAYPEGSVFILNDGFNCAVTYDENSNILRVTGGVGLGKGQSDANPWDDEDDQGIRGIRTINGVNQNGVVEIETGSSVQLIGSVGDLEILVLDQGDDE